MRTLGALACLVALVACGAMHAPPEEEADAARDAEPECSGAGQPCLDVEDCGWWHCICAGADPEESHARWCDRTRGLCDGPDEDVCRCAVFGGELARVEYVGCASP